MRRFSTLAALLIVAVVAPRSTAQVTIDFDTLGSANFQTFPSVTEDGFTLTPGAGTFGDFGMHGSTQTNYPGSPALFHRDGGSTTLLTRVGGDPFDLTSMQVSELINSGTQTVPLNFTGTKLAGGTVSANFTLDGTFGFQTLTFSNDFTALTSVSWVQESQFHQFDTIVVAPVPEPATVLGFAAACGGALGLIRRYRRS